MAGRWRVGASWCAVRRRRAGQGWRAVAAEVVRFSSGVLVPREGEHVRPCGDSQARTAAHQIRFWSKPCRANRSVVPPSCHIVQNLYSLARPAHGDHRATAHRFNPRRHSRNLPIGSARQ